jgi:DNA-binding CsgD family transcriptional regulator
MSCGALVLDSSGAILEINLSARELLEQETAPAPDESGPDWSRRALKKLLMRAGSRFRVDAEVWITVPANGSAPLVLHAIPLSERIESGPHTMLVLVDLGLRPKPSIGVLHRLFDLTPAEARLAISIGSGKTLGEIALEAKLSNATLRSQLSSIFTKTRTRRQPELVALVARVAILP